MDKENQVTRQQVVNGKSANRGKINGNARSRTKKIHIENVPWQNQDIRIVDNVKECRKIVNELRLRCNKYNVLGIGCGFTRYSRDRVGLLLLSTHDGLCALIRLCCIQPFTEELREILEDENILKVGFNPFNVAMKLTSYGVYISGIIDLRYLARKCDALPGNLAMLSAEHLNVKLGEDHRLDEVRWKRNRKNSELKSVDVNYAAKSVRVLIELFKKFEEKLSPPSGDVHQFIDEHCSAYLNKLYRYPKSLQKQTNAVDGSQDRELVKPEIHLIRTVEECQAVVRLIREYVQALRPKWSRKYHCYCGNYYLKHCNEKNLLGFGCQYTFRQTVTLLQLSTHRGLCAFVQLSKLKSIPAELQEILKDEGIIKVGVKTTYGADRLDGDYGACVANTIDLRHLAMECKFRVTDLDRLSEEYLNINLNVDDWRLLATDWKADTFSADALDYAAKTMQVTIELFKVLEEKLVQEKCEGDRTKFNDLCAVYLNQDYPKSKSDPKSNVTSQSQRDDENISSALTEQDIRLVSNEEECKAVVKQLQLHCDEYNAIGFDCEWVPMGRQKVAMLQLASHRGLCVLIRLCKLQRIPAELREIMNDKEIIKAGIAPKQDVDKLFKDYRLKVSSTLDLVQLARKCGYKSVGLASLTKEVLNVKLPHKCRGLIVDKMHGNWEKPTLDDVNIKYAANDAHASIELFKMFEAKLTPPAENSTDDNNQTKNLQQFIYKHCLPILKNK